MNRRKLLQMATSTAGAVWIGNARAQAPPMASPIAAPSSLALPVTYADVAEEYEAAAASLLEHGRSITNQLQNGDYDALFDRFSPDMQAAVSIDILQTLLPSYETNRAHFEVLTYALVFDAQVTGNTMSGFLQSGSLVPFDLQRAAATPSAAISPVATSAALAGSWSGAAHLPDGSQLGLELTISDENQQETLSIPDQQVLDIPVENISFQTAQPLGERLDDRAIPKGPETQLYWAQYDWGGRGLTITVNMDAAGSIIGLRILPEWQLPPDPAADIAPLPPLQLPFDGLWWVLWGGETVSENYHAASPQQRHASDIMIWNDGATWHDDPGRNENYWVWGQPVLTPIDGAVVTVADGVESNIPGALPTNPADIAGNHVVLQIGEQAYLYLAHMQAGTITVKKGDTITAGTRIGLAGNSGNSSEPHLHIHVQNEPDILSPTAIGLPIILANALIDGEPANDASFEQGDFIART